MEDMESASETGIVTENGGLRDLKVIWRVARGEHRLSAFVPLSTCLGTKPTGRLCVTLFFQLWGRWNICLNVTAQLHMFAKETI